MKNHYKNLLIIGSIGFLTTACNSGSSTTADQTNPSTTKVLFVCGGNTGRSPTAEALANANGINAFSRASGLDPTDPLEMEQGALDALTRLATSENKTSDFYTKYIQGRRHAQQMSYSDILKSSAIYPMTEGHMCRVVLNIQTNASSNDEAKEQFSKVHLISSCATGKHVSVQDGFGTPKDQEVVVYDQIINQLNSYVLTIKNNNNSCVTPTEETKLTSTLSDAIDYCCSKYSSDLNKRFNQYCATPH